MMKALVVVVVILALTDHSDANWCICRPDASDSALQKAIDYACGAGADCTPITQNGVCYQPNTLKAHCSYAVNSYYQRKGQSSGTCDFSSSATVVTTDPSPGGSCSFPATGSSGGGGGVTTNPPTTTTPSTNMPPPSSTTPSTNMPPSTTTPSSSNMPPSSTTTPSSSTFGPPSGGVLGGGIGTGLGPSGSGIGTDTSDGQRSNLFSLVPTIWFSGLFFLWV